MEGSGEGGTAALGQILAVFGGDRKKRCRRWKGITGSAFQAGW